MQETLTQLIIGFFEKSAIAYFLLGINVYDTMWMSLSFSIIVFIRSYSVRRYFNRSE